MGKPTLNVGVAVFPGMFKCNLKLWTQIQPCYLKLLLTSILSQHWEILWYMYIYIYIIHLHMCKKLNFNYFTSCVCSSSIRTKESFNGINSWIDYVVNENRNMNLQRILTYTYFTTTSESILFEILNSNYYIYIWLLCMFENYFCSSKYRYQDFLTRKANCKII